MLIHAGSDRLNRVEARLEAVVKWVAIAFGMTNAAVTAYWLVGGTALLSTIGGEIEEWGRRRTAGVLIVLAIVFAVKVVVAALPLVLDRIHRRPFRRLGRAAGWAAAVVLVLYGGLLTVVGLLVQFGVVEKSGDADDTALAWHAYMWDPWFLAWGIALGSWLWLSNQQVDREAELHSVI